MTTAKVATIWEPGQKVICFNKEIPEIHWIATEEFHRCQFTDGNTNWVFVADNYTPPESNWGSIVRSGKIQLYTEELWLACEKWINQKMELEDDFLQLQKGKVPQIVNRPVN